MPISPFIAAINQIVDEKGLPKEIVISTIEAALAAAYRKEYGRPHQIIKTKLDSETGDFDVFQVFHVVKKTDLKDEQTEKTLTEAKKITKLVKIGDEVDLPLPKHSEFGRIAAQTAKQVIIQRIREAERDVLFNLFKEKEGQLLVGTIQQIEGQMVIVNLGKANSIMPIVEQIPGEHYYLGQRLRFYLKGVEESIKGPRIIVSRSDAGLIKGLFTMEVPEVLAGTVEIMGIAREAGSRSKVAVKANDLALDPVGSCVGQRGARIQAIIAEIGQEKIDIILYDDDIKEYINHALSPAKIDSVKVSKKEPRALVYVPEDQLSLAIGRGGQNVRLAGRLTGYTIDIEKTPVAKTKKTSQGTKKESNTPSTRYNSQITTDNNPKKSVSIRE